MTLDLPWKASDEGERACGDFFRRPMAPTVVQNRVDWVTLAYRVQILPAFVQELEERSLVARKHGRAALVWGNVIGQLSYSRTARTYHVKNADYVMRIDLCAPGRTEGKDGDEPGWTVEVVWSGQAMADQDVDAVIRATRKLAASCAVDGRVWESRLRRLDLCADVAGWEIDEEQASRVVKRPRALRTTHPRKCEGEVPAAEIAPVSVHTRREIEGLTIGAGGDVVCRVYDKPEELKKKGEELTAAERARWTRGGWDGEAPVMRVEYQLRGAVLRELGLRDPDKPYEPTTGQIFRTVSEVLDRVWLWALGWARLAKNDNERPARRTTDPIWVLLAGVRFSKKAPAAAHGRVRVRGGATHEQLLGCALSVLGARGKLVPQREGIAVDDDAAPLDATHALVADVRGLFLAASDEVATHLEKKWKSAAGGREHLAVVSNATRVRFEAFPRALMVAFGQLAKVRPARAAPVAAAVA
jgi:hypothetical protein